MLQEPKVVFSEAYRVLNSGGRLCLLQTLLTDVPGKPYISSSLHRAVSRILDLRPKIDSEDTHVQDFSEEELNALMGKIFKAEESRIVRTQDGVCLFAKCVKKSE